MCGSFQSLFHLEASTGPHSRRGTLPAPAAQNNDSGRDVARLQNPKGGSVSPPYQHHLAAAIADSLTEGHIEAFRRQVTCCPALGGDALLTLSLPSDSPDNTSPYREAA
jgi:hypothetical protein